MYRRLFAYHLVSELSKWKDKGSIKPKAEKTLLGGLAAVEGAFGG